MPRVLLPLGPDNAGLAVARALRDGLPDLTLTAVSRAPHGPGVSADLWDEVWTAPSWDTLNLEAHIAEIAERLTGDGWYLPTSAAEAHWLAQADLASDRVLSPAPSALSAVTGPAPHPADALPVGVPDWIPLSAPVEDLHAFSRRHNWNLWLRTPLGEREPLGHWTEFDRVRDQMRDRASNPNALYLQQQVDGTPLTLSYAAHKGSLLETALVRPAPDRRDTYHVDPSPDALRTALQDVFSTLGWTGGGSLALIEGPDGVRWLDTWHPHFGGEVEGLAQCSANLPAVLLAACTEKPVRSGPSPTSAFSTIRSTSPVSHSLDKAPSPSESTQTSPPVSSSTVPSLSNEPLSLNDDLCAVLEDLPDDWATANTPRSVLLPTRTRNRFTAFTDAADRIEDAFDLDTARIGLSIKTNPDDHLLDTARTTGMLAETIHPDEMDHARRHGYRTDEIIVNGPVQALLPELNTAPFALFGDAVKDLRDLPFDPSETIIGVRTRPPERGPSRFGVDLSDTDRLARLCNRLAALPASTSVGLHLHAPSSTLGHDRWWNSVDRVLSWAQTIQDRTNRPVKCLDLGGGWHPDDWLDVFVPALLDRRDALRRALPDLDTILLEPGKALSQPLGVVISRVLDVRPSRNEVILDASLAELSNIDYHPHRLLAHTAHRGWHRLRRGTGRLLGRLCMEADILGRRRQVDHLSPGDTIVICDAGAYDASMTYPFGRGTTATD